MVQESKWDRRNNISSDKVTCHKKHPQIIEFFYKASMFLLSHIQGKW